jgi:hypothetical protein
MLVILIERDSIIDAGNSVDDCLTDFWPATQLGCKTAFIAIDPSSLRSRKDDQRCNGIERDLVPNDLSQLGSISNPASFFW